jgi:hypothetical protein
MEYWLVLIGIAFIMFGVEGLLSHFLFSSTFDLNEMFIVHAANIDLL